MCGILAIFSNNNSPTCRDQALSDVQFLQSRGPDHSVDIIDDRGIYLFRRLAINDVSINGDQPMTDGNILMMCNGEIYNHKSLEEEFEIKCHSESDCEIILHLYKKIGFVETVKRLDGVFAIVLVDGDDVYLARDIVGVRPLYMGLTKEEHFLAVSSVPNCLSFCMNVTQFPPGTISLHKKHSGNISLKNYKVMKSLEKLSVTSLPSRLEGSIASQKVKEVLINATKKRLMADRPIGCLLSGGLDSSIITAILVKFLGSKNVRTYSIGMQDSLDLYHARKVSQYLGTDHHEVIFTPEEGFAVIPQVIHALGTNDITTIRASVGMYLISRYISKQSQDRVIFSGEGADEAFCGYLYFHNAPSEQEAEQESIRLLTDLHNYDVLRADRSVSVHGLELRVPFLDKQVLQTAISCKRIPQNGLEKTVLREAFKDMLPKEVVFRRKDGFSDGVSGKSKSWYQYIHDFVDQKISDDMFDNQKYITKEAMYYDTIFRKHFKNLQIKNEHWMPKWSDSKDPSGRLISVFNENI